MEQAFDRVEGRAPAPDAQFPEELTYGEAYGVVPGSALAPLLRGAQGGIGERLAALASRIELHADAMNDVAVVAKVSGADAAGLDDLASSIGAAMAVGRMQAKASGSTGLAELLEFARVERGGGEFSVELAVPADALERWFQDCGDAGAAAAAPR